MDMTINNVEELVSVIHNDISENIDFKLYSPFVDVHNDKEVIISLYNVPREELVVIENALNRLNTKYYLKAQGFSVRMAVEFAD